MNRETIFWHRSVPLAICSAALVLRFGLSDDGVHSTSTAWAYTPVGAGVLIAMVIAAALEYTFVAVRLAWHRDYIRVVDDEVEVWQPYRQYRCPADRTVMTPIRDRKSVGIGWREFSIGVDRLCLVRSGWVSGDLDAIHAELLEVLLDFRD